MLYDDHSDHCLIVDSVPGTAFQLSAFRFKVSGACGPLSCAGFEFVKLVCVCTYVGQTTITDRNPIHIIRFKYDRLRAFSQSTKARFRMATTDPTRRSMMTLSQIVGSKECKMLGATL
jgi:hypothetical protein